MGRTVSTFTNQIDAEYSAWGKYRRALRKEDREFFDAVFLSAKRHLAENFHLMRAVPIESILVSHLVDQGKLIKELNARIEFLERIVCKKP